MGLGADRLAKQVISGRSESLAIFSSPPSSPSCFIMPMVRVQEKKKVRRALSPLTPA